MLGMVHENIKFTASESWRLVTERDVADFHGPEADVLRRFQETVEAVTEDADDQPVFDVSVEATAEYEETDEVGCVGVTQTYLITLACDEGTTRADVLSADALEETLVDRLSYLEPSDVRVVEGYEPDIGGDPSSGLVRRE